MNEDKTCPICDGPLMILGTLGCMVHARCQHCGFDVNWPYEPENMKAKTEREALEQFVTAIEATGGVLQHPSGIIQGCAADPDWLDMAVAYVDACEALGRKPMIKPTED